MSETTTPTPPVPPPPPAVPGKPTKITRTYKFNIKLNFSPLHLFLVLAAAALLILLVGMRLRPELLPSFLAVRSAAYCDKYSGIYAQYQQDACVKAGCAVGSADPGYTYGPSGEVRDMGEPFFKCIPR